MDTASRVNENKISYAASLLLCGEYAGVDAASGAEIVGDVSGSGFAGLLQGFGVGKVAVHHIVKLVDAADRHTSATLYETRSLTEFLVVRTKYDRDAVDGSLIDVVYPGAETSAYIRHIGVAVEA